MRRVTDRCAYTWQGVTLTVPQWARRLGITPAAFRLRWRNHRLDGRRYQLASVFRPKHMRARHLGARMHPNGYDDLK